MADHKARRAPGFIQTQPATFPARMRIVSGADFSRVFKDNTRSSDGSFTVLAGGGSDTGPRLGMAIARKAAGNAVQRNRIKRLVRESFRLNQHALTAADFVVLARPGVAKKTNAVLLHSLYNHWRRFWEDQTAASREHQAENTH